ncbi:MAG: type II toxin-antitoxin system VapC family toxin [Acidimicrobiales bacterium]
MSTGLLDTSVVIDWNDRDVANALPDRAAVSVITLAELTAGPRLASTSAESARRQSRLQLVEATFDPIPFDVAAARSYGQVVTAVADAGRSHRSRIADLLIAATAHANELALYTRNPDDFIGLENLIEIVSI